MVAVATASWQKPATAATTAVKTFKGCLNSDNAPRLRAEELPDIRLGLRMSVRVGSNKG